MPVAVVTGGASGLGAALGERCAALGMDVVLLDLDGKRAATEAARLADAYGVDAVGLDAGVPAEWAAAALKPACAVQGNLDNLLAVAGGPALEAETRRILCSLGPDRFIFNLGHGVLPDTPPEHIGRIAELPSRTEWDAKQLR